MSRVLIADDQTDVLEALRILLKGEGHQTEAVTSLAGVFQVGGEGSEAFFGVDLIRCSGASFPSGRRKRFGGGGSLSSVCNGFLCGDGFLAANPPAREATA